MALSRSTRIILLLVIDTLFFFLEIIIGYAVHSLALVADSFHMLNDVISLLVALWAIKLSKQKSTSSYTYGWQRAEVLGALINGVFLVALCLSIFLEAIQRFFEPQVITYPQLVLGVGCAGLASNIVGLFLFHDHGHSHKGESHSHDHSSDAERGYAHSHNGEAHSHSHSHSQSISHRPHLDDEGPIEDILPGNVVAKTISVQSSFKRGFAHGRTASGSSAAPSSPYARSKNPHDNRHHTRSGSRHRRFADPETSIHVLPAQNRQEIINAAEGSSTEDDDLLESPGSPTATENTPLITSSDSTSHGHGSSSAAKHNRSDSMSHATHNHAKPKDPKKSGGYSHDLNMQGVFLHVLGDALGNIGVILTALFIWKTDYSWRFYTDPAISLLITMIIFSSALPLCKSASKILLQAVPRGISLDEVKADIMSIKGVMSVHELHIWQLSDVKMIASLHIQIGFDPETEEDRADGGGKYKGKKYMRLAKAIRECLHEYGIHSSTIQPEYIPSAIDGGEEHSRANRGYGGVTFASGSGGGAGASRRGSGSGHSTAGDSEDACLLDCGEECGNGKCCGPMVVSEGHGHAH